MTTAKRIGRRWSVNEVLQLQREYELLKWSLDKIAEKHQRTVNGVMLKLDAEGFASYNFLYGQYHNPCPVVELKPSISEDESDYSADNEDEEAEDDDYSQEECDEEESDEDESDNEYDPIEDLAERVWNLETNVKNIGSMIGEMFQSWKTSKKSVNFLER